MLRTGLCPPRSIYFIPNPQCDFIYQYGFSSLLAQMLKNMPAIQETWVWSLQADPLEKEMATHSSILAWRIPWTEEPGGLQSMWSQRVRHNWVTNTFRAFQEVIKVTWVICMRPWSNKIDIPIRGRNSKNVHTQRKTHLRTQSEGIYHPAP